MVRCNETEFDRQTYDEAPVDWIKWPITEKMIYDCLNEQLPTGEEGKYSRMVKLDIRTVTQLKMEYKSISVIDNLMNMAALTKLQLCNNVIAKIENLDPLVNLTWLDLSFNCITKIENLDNLRKLEVLDLHRNFISYIENMDNLLRMELFHISTNKLDNYENVKYLRRFVRLRSASFFGNPIARNPNFMPYLIAFVPQLTQVNYKQVEGQDRDVANAKYRTQVDRLINTEDKLIRRASVVEAEEQVKLVYKEAFVDGFQEDLFWNSLYEKDTEGTAILQLGDTDDIQVMFRELFKRSTKDMFSKGMKSYESRQAEMLAYNTAVKEELDIVQKAGNKLTEEFVEYSRPMIKDIRMLTSVMEDYKRRVQHGLAHDLPPEFPQLESQLNDLCKEFIKKLHEVWAQLINNEIEFNEQLEDVNDLLDRSIREIITNWLELLRGQFGSLREINQQLHERMVEALVTYGDFRSSDPDIPQGLKELVMDKDALMNHLQMSHDHHISVVDGTEDKMSNVLKDWQENFSIGLATTEYQRNRARLIEISHFTDTHYGYLEGSRALLHTSVYIPPVRADQDCLEAVECEPLQWYERLVKRLKVKERKFKASLAPNKGPKLTKEKEKEEEANLKLSFVL